MCARTLATASRASAETVTLASWRATATTSSGVVPPEPRVTVSGAWVVSVIVTFLLGPREQGSLTELARLGGSWGSWGYGRRALWRLRRRGRSRRRRGV